MNLRRMTFPDEMCPKGHNLKREGVYMALDGTREGCYKCRLIRGRVAHHRAPTGRRNQLTLPGD